MNGGEAQRWLIVAAVSTDKRGQTVDQQVRALEGAAARHGAEVVEVLEFRQSRFKEASAREVERAVLERIAHGGVDTVAAWALDRLTRRGPLEAMLLVRTLEDHYKVKLFSLQEPFLSTATMDAGLRGLMLPLFAWLAERESGRKSDRVREKVDAKKALAENGGGRAKWGRGRMPTDEDRRQVHDAKAAGWKVPRIVEASGLSRATVYRVLGDPRPEGVSQSSLDSAPISTLNDEASLNRPIETPSEDG